MNQYTKFKSLHRTSEPFILPNAWDVKSAQVLEELKFPAIATSSAAVANSLGYKDGEEMEFKTYFFIIKRISESISVPLSVDLEFGYADSHKGILENILQLSSLQIAGINIEDSYVYRNKRYLQKSEDFGSLLLFLRNSLKEKGIQLFINARIDTNITACTDRLKETIDRVILYEKLGADGIFIPGIKCASDIKSITSLSNLPLNVMTMPNLPSFEELKSLGVKRISTGNALYEKMFNQFRFEAMVIFQMKNFTCLFDYQEVLR